MRSMFQKWRELAKDDAGATAIEYGLIIFIIGIALGVAAAATGTSLESLINLVADTVRDATAAGAGAT